MVLFFVHIRLQPISTRIDTHFPYTTLFRSGEHIGPALDRNRAVPRLPPGRECTEGRSPLRLRDVPQLSPAERLGGRAAPDRATITRKLGRDRKSASLNSSHYCATRMPYSA